MNEHTIIFRWRLFLGPSRVHQKNLRCLSTEVGYANGPTEIQVMKSMPQ